MFKKILVALDHSETSPAIFTAAVELAQKLQASLMLVHVLSSYENGDRGIPFPAPPEAYGMGMSEVAWNSYAKRWQAYETQGLEKLRDYQQRAQAAGLEAEFSQNSGMPGERLCGIASLWNADLIVIGSRGRRGLRELLMGSVSNYVTHHATCSVLVIHPQGNKAAIAAEETTTAIRSPEAEAWEVAQPVAQ